MAVQSVFRKNLLATVVGLSALPVSSSLIAQELEKEAIYEEVIVTATRRSQSIQDVPYNISALGSEALKNAGVSTMQDLTRMVPGLSSIDFGPRSSGVSSNLVIRGLSAQGGSLSANVPNASVPLVSTYVDETPMFVNLKLTDISRVEVLRGPQGTLYGSGAMGGTLRMIHNTPDPDAFGAQLSSRISETDGAGDLNYSMESVINIPLGDAAALRVSGGYDKLAGFLDAPNRVVLDSNNQPVLADPANPLTSGMTFTSQDDVDEADTKHLRVAFGADIGDKVNVLFAYNHQADNADDFSVRTLDGDDYTTPRAIASPLDREVDLASLDVTVDLGFASFTSSTSYSDNQAEGARDLTGIIQRISDGSPFTYGFYPRISVSMDESTGDESTVQEFRFTSTTDGKFDWVVGAFYRDQKTTLEYGPQRIHGFDAWSELPGSADVINDIFGAPGLFPTFADFVVNYNGAPRPSLNGSTDNGFTFARTTDFQDLALFGELTFHVTDAWQLTAGIRQFWQEFDQQLTQTLPVCGPFCSDVGDPLGTIDATVSQDFDDNIIKLNTSYDLNEETMVYLTWAEGFRRGGGNGLATGACFLCEADTSLLSFDPDFATNTEIGIKGSLADKAVRYTVSAFLIEWEDMQIDGVTSPGAFPFVFNGGDASTQGIEIELSANLSDDLSVTLGYTHVQAELDEDFVVENVVGQDGDSLPAVPENQFSLALDYYMNIGDNAGDLHFHLNGAYRDETRSAFNEFAPGADPGTLVSDPIGQSFAVLDAYTLWGASINYEIDNWTAGLFINNLTNEDGVTSINTGVDPTRPVEFISRPRTVGFNFSFSWD